MKKGKMSIAERRRKLQARSRKLQEQIGLRPRLAEQLRQVLQDLSDLEPHAYVAIFDRARGKVGVFGLRSDVPSGIEVNGLRFCLVLHAGAEAKYYLHVSAANGVGMGMLLDLGRQCAVFPDLNDCSFSEVYDLFFSVDTHAVVSFIRQEEAKLSHRAA